MSTSDDPAWDERLGKLLGEDHLPGASMFIAGLPPGYREATTPEEAADDYLATAGLAGADAAITGVAAAGAAGPPGAGAAGGGFAAGPPPGAGAAGHPAAAPLGSRYRLAVRPPLEEWVSFRIRRLGTEATELTTAVPLVESFGLVVVQSLPLILEGTPAGPVHLDDISVRFGEPGRGDGGTGFDPGLDGPRLVEALGAASAGRTDIDGLNRLVLTAGLGWRQVTVLRAYLRYWHQITGLSRRQLVEPPVRYPLLSRALVSYFEARFDPTTDDQAGGPSGPTAGARKIAGEQAAGGDRGAAARRTCADLLDRVDHLEDDRVLRAALGLVDATLRTNYFSVFAASGPDRAGTGPAAGGRPPGCPPLVLKLDSRAVPEMFRPTPLVETFLHSPTVEAIHLRAGLIARGGIRWSERLDDFRTEVLDLAFAQVKKNAVIVPTGAKGGFVCRIPALPGHVGGAGGTERPTPAQIRDAYQAFVAGLLDVTDDIVGGDVVTPAGVVAFDGPDPYLVVAADKGTAAFSDLANGIAEARGFWLGDAFASGGSHGYDHKAMGITARGAWVSVRRHFRELDIDVATDPIRVVGVGDMSGDVFGNGMLQSRAIRLVAAFDHRHVFIDPDPDPAASYEERRRLAGLDRSSWDDYDRSVISRGGGVWSRDAKSIPLSPETRCALGVEEETLSPPQLVLAILRAPVDLLWFGGIGTFVKAAGEADADVADHADDAVRVTADQVRARVVAEGANLGVTQRARIQYSRRGGRINADFIDNAAGVATSDREVNLKILLSLAAQRGRLVPSERDGYLERAEADVIREVLRQVDHSVGALNRAASTSAADVDAYEALIDHLEAEGAFDRTVEVLPDSAEMERRRQAGAGLIRPELATILTYAKSDLVAAIEMSPVSSSPALLDSAVDYFPPEMRAEFPDLVPEHRLVRQLVATDVAGEIVDNMGIVWAHDLASELGCPLDDAAAAFWAARRLTGAAELWAELETPGPLGADAEATLHGAVVAAVASLTRAYLLEGGPTDPDELIARDGPIVADGVDGPAAAFTPPAGWSRLGIGPGTAGRFARAASVAEAVRAGTVVRAAGGALSAGAVADAAEALRALRTLTAVDAVARAAASVAGAGHAGSAGSVDGRSYGVDVPQDPPARLLVWQARAIQDDLDGWLVGTAAAILAGTAAGHAGPAEAVATWAESQQEPLRRIWSVIDDGLTARPVAERLAAAALAVRRLPSPQLRPAP